MSSSGERPIYLFEGFRLDSQHRLLSRADGETIPLAPKAFDLLLYLVEHRGELLEKRAILGAVWPTSIVEENNLNQCISSLRRVLGERPGQHRFIVTEPGHGYRFVAPIETLAEQRDLGADGPATTAVTSTGVPAGLFGKSGAVVGFSAIALLIAAVVTMIVGQGPSGENEAQTSAEEIAVSPPLNSVSRRRVLPKSVAVLPFDDLSPEPDKPYLARGLHSDIIGKLTQLSLNVITRDAVLQYETDRPSYPEIAAALGVQTLLVGTVQYTDAGIRVNVQLVDPASGINLWSPEPYQSDGLLDLFKVQADVATKVADALDAEFSAAEQQRVEARPTASMEAYRAYWQAFEARDRGDRGEAAKLFEQATELDPQFALAFGELALLYARSVIDFASDPSVPLELDVLEQRVSANAQTALALDPAMATAYLALGELHMYSWRWSEAEKAFASAYRLNRNDPDVLLSYSQFQTNRGQYAAALPLAQRYLELDPPLPDPSTTGSLYALWLAHVYSGNVDAALNVLNEHLELQPRQVPARLNLGFVEARRGNRDAAATAFRRVEELTGDRRSPTLTANLAHGYARIGQHDEAARLFREIQEMAVHRPIGAGTWAMAYLAVGDFESAEARLHEALRNVEDRRPDLGWFSLMILKHNLTDDPALEMEPFKQLRGRIHGS